MAIIDYPTQRKIEDYLNGIYGKKLSLSGSINIIGTNTEAHPKDDQKGYGLLDEVEVNALTGVDIPILITGDKGDKGTIAIVAQDPKRSDGDKQLPKDNNGETIKDKIIVGTPFAFHYERNAYSKTKVYRIIVDGLLEDGYKVYITDAHKIYSEDKTFSIDKDSEMNLLKDEIKEMNPKCVVTFGEDALNYIEDAYKKDEKKPLCVNVLHPSSNNTSNWDSWIFEQAYWEVKKNNCEGFWSGYAQKRGHRDKVYGEFSGKSLENVIVDSTIDIIKKYLK